MAERFSRRLEAQLKALNDGLQRPRTEKSPDKLWARIDRMNEKQHGTDLQTDESSKKPLVSPGKNR